MDINGKTIMYAPMDKTNPTPKTLPKETIKRIKRAMSKGYIQGNFTLNNILYYWRVDLSTVNNKKTLDKKNKLC